MRQVTAVLLHGMQPHSSGWKAWRTVGLPFLADGQFKRRCVQLRACQARKPDRTTRHCGSRLQDCLSGRRRPSPWALRPGRGIRPAILGHLGLHLLLKRNRVARRCSARACALRMSASAWSACRRARMFSPTSDGADMERGIDALGDDHLGLQVLRVVHLVAGISDPAGRVHVHDVAHVDDLHCSFLPGSGSVDVSRRRARAPIDRPARARREPAARRPRSPTAAAARCPSSRPRPRSPPADRRDRCGIAGCAPRCGSRCRRRGRSPRPAG